MLGHDNSQRTGRIGSAQASAQIMRIGHAVEHEQQWRAFASVQQLFEHRLAPDLTRADVGNYTLVNTFDPSIHFTALGLPDGHTILARQRNQRLNTRVVTTLGQPDVLDAFRMVTKQSFYGVHAVDFFQLTHDLALGLRAPLLFAAGAEPVFDGPLRCLLAGLSDEGAEPDLSDFPDDVLLPPFASAKSAFFSSRLLRTSAFFAAASPGRYASEPVSLAEDLLRPDLAAGALSFSAVAAAGGAVS